MIAIHQTDQPEAALNACLHEFASSARDSDGVAFEYAFARHYLPDAPPLQLIAVVALKKEPDGVRVALSVAEKSDALLRGLNCLRATWDQIKCWCGEHELAWLELDQPLLLQPVHIPKPWGQEIWYTGIEARGQSQVVDQFGRTLPLPWLLSVCPGRLLGRGRADPILLKTLDPLPEPVLGDLYFEMHEEKREVYVVTHVDEAAWPEGIGGIRFGFNQRKRAAAPDDEAFKADYLAAVEAYRAVRLQIDGQLDGFREEEGIPLDAPVDPEILRGWLSRLPEELRKQEGQLRKAMESFVHVDPLQVGDVVRVPCYTPHSLLHGVRTVEFQTPVYERKILSFAQKVLTQAHWDTASALEQVSLDAPPASELPVLHRNDHARLEEVAVFEDFRVERLTLKAGEGFEYDTGGTYCLLMGVSGRLGLNGWSGLGPEQAALVAVNRQNLALGAGSDGDVIALLARPVE